MTYKEYRERLAKLAPSQIEWLKGKSKWEQMTKWAVMEEWSIPATSNLNTDGSWRSEE